MKIWLKRGLITVGVLFTLFVATAIIVPLVVNIDQYRPQIEKAVNDNINGKITIGKLALSLWGRIEVDIRDVKLVDAKNKELISFKQAYALLPFWSFITASPTLTLRLDRPEVFVLKDKQGRLNLLSLVKPAAPGQPVPAEQPATPAPATPAGKGDIPGLGLIAASSINIEMINAALRYFDEATNFNQKVDDLNLRLRDISMTKPMQLEIWADIATKMGSQLSVAGPFRIEGVIKPKFNGVEFQQADVDLFAKFDDLVVAVPGVFNKAKGIPANIKTSVLLSKERIIADKVLLTFHNAQLQASAVVNDLTPPTPEGVATPRIDFNLASTTIDLAPWNELIVPLKGYDVKGAMTLGANAKGPTSKLDYKANLNVKDFSANIPGLLAKPTLQVDVAVVTDELKEAKVLVEAPENHILVTTNVKNFAKPNVTVNVNSNGINLDKLLPPPPEPAKTAQNEKAPAGGSGGGPAGTQPPANQEPPLDVDGMLEPVRTNEFLKGLVTNVAVRIKSFKGMKLDVSNIKVDFKLQDLVAAIENLELDIFQGHVATKMALDIKPAQPTYKLNLDVANIDLQTAVTSQMESLRNTLLGKMSMKAGGNGASLNSDKLIKNLVLDGDFKVADAKFASVDVATMVVDGLNGSLGKIKEKVPGMGDKNVKMPPDRGMKYKVIGSNFKMANGKVSMPNFVTESYPKQGIDLKGDTEIDLVNDTLKAEWFVVDTYDVTGAAGVSVASNGVTVDRLLAKGSDPVSFPITVGCKLSAPCYKYDSIPAHLGGIAINNITAKVKGKLDAALKAEQEKLRAQAAELAKQKEEQARALLKEKEAQAKKEAEERAKKQVGDKAKEKLKGLKW